MSEPIQSISQSNYILHNIDAKKLYVQEPLFTANSGDAVYVGWRPDETVLWSGNSATATLSESLDNFEKVDITYTYWTDNYTTRTLYGWSGKPTFTEGWFDNNAAAAGIFITRLTANDAHTVIGTNANKYWNPPAGGGLADALNRFAITKVVGINRKENA